MRLTRPGRSSSSSVGAPDTTPPADRNSSLFRFGQFSWPWTDSSCGEGGSLAPELSDDDESHDRPTFSRSKTNARKDQPTKPKNAEKYQERTPHTAPSIPPPLRRRTNIGAPQSHLPLQVWILGQPPLKLLQVPREGRGEVVQPIVREREGGGCEDSG